MGAIDNRMRTHIRWVIRRDYPAIMEIERDCFAYPWSEEQLVRVMRQRNAIGLCAEHNEQPVGYMIYELRPKSIVLLNFAVSVYHRRFGVGRSLIEKLKSKLSPGRKTRITLHCWERNVEGQLFFRSQGFRVANSLKGYFDYLPDDDAYFMQYRISGAARTDDCDSPK
jgi:[ribosomal protein S18]-alanine N-acetyltransferase